MIHWSACFADATPGMYQWSPQQIPKVEQPFQGPRVYERAAPAPLGPVQSLQLPSKCRTSSAARLRMGGVPTWNRRMPGAGS